MSIRPAPSYMYGPDETRSAPYPPRFPSKQCPTSGGIGEVAGSVRRWRKSLSGRVRSNAIVLAFEVRIPAIDRARPARYASKPAMTRNTYAYWAPFLGRARRSIAYRMSVDVIVRPTGGPNRMPRLSVNVYVLPPFVAAGTRVARSGTIFVPARPGTWS